MKGDCLPDKSISKKPIFQFPNFQIWKYPWKIECFLEDLLLGSQSRVEEEKKERSIRFHFDPK